MSRGAGTELPASPASSRCRRMLPSQCSSTRTAASDRRRFRWCSTPFSPAARTWCSARDNSGGVIPCTRRLALGLSRGSWPGAGACRSPTSARYGPSAWTCCSASTCRTGHSGGQSRWWSRRRCAARASSRFRCRTRLDSPVAPRFLARCSVPCARATPFFPPRCARQCCARPPSRRFSGWRPPGARPPSARRTRRRRSPGPAPQRDPSPRPRRR